MAQSSTPNTSIREIVSASISTDNDIFVWKALEVMGLKEHVERLPYKLDTYVGNQWEKGTDLSSGQYKRLSLATVYYRAHHSPSLEVILLDEPMGNIDPKTRAWFYRMIGSGELLGTDKTVVVCLHDNGARKFFPRVITMRKGKVVRDVKRAKPS